MSTIAPGPDRADLKAEGQAGYSLLEMLVVLALMGLAATLVMPSGAALLDRATAHAVFFDFQRQVTDLRLAAYRTETTVDIPAAPVAGGPITLRSGWTYAFDRPLRISEGGACGPASAVLRRGGRVVMHLRISGADCRMLRLA